MMRHLARCRVQFGQKADASSFLHFLRELLHGLLRDNAACYTSKRSPGVIEREKKFCPLPLAFFPQGECLLDGVLFRVQPPALNGAACESLLVGGEVYVHWPLG
jgi:hypothetical protein